MLAPVRRLAEVGRRGWRGRGAPRSHSSRIPRRSNLLRHTEQAQFMHGYTTMWLARAVLRCAVSGYRVALSELRLEDERVGDRLEQPVNEEQRRVARAMRTLPLHQARTQRLPNVRTGEIVNIAKQTHATRKHRCVVAVKVIAKYIQVQSCAFIS